MLTLVTPDFDPSPENAVICHYCNTKIGTGESIILKTETEQWVSVTTLHKNCVVAFATRILNEFEKL